MRFLRTRLPIGVLIIGFLPRSAGAQTTEADRNDGGLFATSARIVAPVALLWLGMEADETIRTWAQGPRLQESVALGHVSSVFNPIGSPWPMIAGGATWAAASLAGRQQVADVAWHTVSALAATTAVTVVIKGTVGRARPYHAADDADVFDPGEGISGNTHYNSFPSGHTATAFALAAVLSAEVAERWPRRRIAVPLVAYSSAALTGFARVYRDKHWSTDVVIGALIGHWVGSRVVRRGHSVRSGLTTLPFFGPAPSGTWAMGVRVPFN